jgi:hypothetical protein
VPAFRRSGGWHQGAPQALAQRMLPHQGAELADQLGGPAEGEVGLDAALEGRQPLLLQARCRRLGEGLECQVRERRARHMASAPPSAAEAAAASPLAIARPARSTSASKRSRSSSSGASWSM